jgi:penicillin-binding protein 1C
MDLQRYALETLRHQILQVRSRNVQDGALLVVDNGTGEVLAYAGNAGDVGSARYVDGTQALRQAGSTLKPFLYGLAFDRRLLTPVSMIDDSALDVPVPGGIYRPRNYDNFFRGLVTARTALASSLNVPAVKTLGLVGVESLVGALRDFGFRDLRPADYYGPSLALGSADVRLWDLAGAYRALANGGVYQPLRLTFGEVPGTRRQALSTAAAFLVSDVLSDREGRSATFSLESPLSTRFWTAVKTGTSKDMRDNWCVGYSDRYTVAVWVGNFSGEPMWDVSGVTGAAPVWLEIMNWLHRDRSSRAPVPPPGIESREVEIAGLGHNRREWFLSGTETSLVKRAASPSTARIAYPAPGTVIALDPDIPAGSQRVFFEVEHAGPSQRWRLDGEDIGECRPLVLWEPRPGKHRLALLDGAGSLLDTVDFEVR